MRKLTTREVEYYAHSVAKELMDFDEPLPPFTTRYPSKLESCLEQPFQEFGGEDLYPGLVSKASILFYLLTKNHPFENGNKRMAVATTLLFFYLNDSWLKIDPMKLYRVAILVAESQPNQRDEVIETLQKVFGDNVQKR